jgi:uncharacterized protein
LNTASRRRFLAFSAALPVSILARRGAAAAEPFAIGTGNYGGVYFPLGNAICRLLNRDAGEDGPRCHGEASLGSVANIGALRDGKAAFALAQSDVVQAALSGTGVFAGAPPFEALRVVFRAHAEPFTVLASRASGIRRLDDLPGKRIGIGVLATGQRATLDMLVRDLGWTPETFASIFELSSPDEVTALCDGRVDAILLNVGHPNGWVQEATLACDAVLVAVDGPKIDALVKKHAAYDKAVIPGGIYQDHPEETPSFGARALVVTTAGQTDDVVYALARVVFEDFATLAQLVPALADLTEAMALPTGQPAPTHAGAERYFREHGLMQ